MHYFRHDRHVTTQHCVLLTWVLNCYLVYIFIILLIAKNSLNLQNSYFFLLITVDTRLKTERVKNLTYTFSTSNFRFRYFP